MIFLSCKANARVFYAKSGNGPHSPSPDAAASPKRPSNVAFFSSMRHGQSGHGIQTANQPEFIPPYLVQGNLGPSL